jgi:hypothetical protein
MMASESRGVSIFPAIRSQESGTAGVESAQSFERTDPRSGKSEAARHAFDKSLHSDLPDRYAPKKIDFEDGVHH